MTKRKKGNGTEEPLTTIAVSFYPSRIDVAIEGADKVRKSRVQQAVRYIFTQLTRERRMLAKKQRSAYEEAVQKLEEIKDHVRQ